MNEFFLFSDKEKLSKHPQRELIENIAHVIRQKCKMSLLKLTDEEIGIQPDPDGQESLFVVGNPVVGEQILFGDDGEPLIDDNGRFVTVKRTNVSFEQVDPAYSGMKVNGNSVLGFAMTTPRLVVIREDLIAKITENNEVVWGKS